VPVAVRLATKENEREMLSVGMLKVFSSAAAPEHPPVVDANTFTV
jgi:hypothetical protein